MCSLINETPLYTLGYPLNSFFRIFIYFFLPPALSFVIYLTLIVTDFSLVYCHIADENPRWGTLTLIFMFVPSIAGSILTLVNPDRWPSDNPFDRKNLRFLALRLWHIFFFPFAAIYRYVHQIFWSIEAMCANQEADVDRTENALRILLKPNSLEFYFFLQSYFHSAPQILLQLYIMFSVDEVNHSYASLQTLSVVMSLMRMATTTMSYQRFERRKVLGVHYPWASKKSLCLSGRLSNTNTMKSVLSEIPPPYEEVQTTNIQHLNVERDENTSDRDEDEVFEEPVLFKGYHLSDELEKDKSISVERGEMLLPDVVVMRDKNEVTNSKTSSSSSIYEEPISYQDEVKPKRVVSIMESPEVEMRRKNQFANERQSYIIEDMSIYVTPPDTPAPRPGSMAFIRSKIVTNAEHFTDMIPKRRHRSDDLDLPVRVRRLAVKGVEQEDGISKFISFMAWFLFIGSRILVLTTFSSFYLADCFYVCLAHYLVVVAFLMWNSWSEDLHRKAFYLFLGYIYIFCLIEFKMKFIKVRLWYGVFFFLITIENFILTSIWFWTGDFNSWWAIYILALICGSFVLSFICFLIYFLILKPKPVTKYPTNSMFSVFPGKV